MKYTGLIARDRIIEKRSLDGHDSTYLCMWPDTQITQLVFFYIIKIPTPPKFVNPKAEDDLRLTLIAVTMRSLQYFICTLDAFQTRILKQLTSILVENAGSVLSILSGILTDKQLRYSIVDNFALELARELIQVPIERRTSPLQKTTRMLSFILNRWWGVIPWRTPGWLPEIKSSRRDPMMATIQHTCLCDQILRSHR